MKKNFFTMLLAMVCIVSTLTGCGNKTASGTVNPVFTTIEEDAIDPEAQIVELNNSPNYYEMKISKGSVNVYFYSIGFDDEGTLIDKSVVTTMPTGVETEDKIVLNATFPDIENPAFAVGFLFEDNTQEYYTLKTDKRGNLKASFVENNEDFMIRE